MMDFKTKKLLAAFGFTAGLMGATTPAVPETNEESNIRLRVFCDTSNFKNFFNHVICLQETSSQASAFAYKFYTSLFTLKALPVENKSYKKMLTTWEKDIRKTGLASAEEDVLILEQYPEICGGMIQNNITNAEQILSSFNTKGYNIPKFCVDAAINFSKKYNVEIDNQEGARLHQHFKNIQDYYADHPGILTLRQENNLQQHRVLKEFWM